MFDPVPSSCCPRSAPVVGPVVQTWLRHELAKSLPSILVQLRVECPDCNYPLNAARFDQLFFYYTAIRKKITRLQRVVDRYWTLPAASSTDEHLLHLAQSDGERLRRELRDIWPCPCCQARYNPTNAARFGGEILPEANQPSTNVPSLTQLIQGA